MRIFGQYDIYIQLYTRTITYLWRMCMILIGRSTYGVIQKLAEKT